MDNQIAYDFKKVAQGSIMDTFQFYLEDSPKFVFKGDVGEANILKGALNAAYKTAQEATETFLQNKTEVNYKLLQEQKPYYIEKRKLGYQVKFEEFNILGHVDKALTKEITRLLNNAHGEGVNKAIEQHKEQLYNAIHNKVDKHSKNKPGA